MGHHIDEQGRFQSDRYPELEPDKIVLSFKDPLAQVLLEKYAKATPDIELGADILLRLDSIEKEV